MRVADRQRSLQRKCQRGMVRRACTSLFGREGRNLRRRNPQTIHSGVDLQMKIEGGLARLALLRRRLFEEQQLISAHDRRREVVVQQPDREQVQRSRARERASLAEPRGPGVQSLLQVDVERGVEAMGLPPPAIPSGPAGAIVDIAGAELLTRYGYGPEPRETSARVAAWAQLTSSAASNF